MKVKKEDLLSTLLPEWPDDLLPAIQTLVKNSGVKIVVLDDDPTGTQTVYDVSVLTEWSADALTAALHEPEALVFVLTNSRSVPLAQAQAINQEIAVNLKVASQITGRDFVVVSRSDSTLRGHYPGELTALIGALGQTIDGTLIIPFFLEGGRLSINDIHYVAEGEWLVPAAETEYARDASFGYAYSNLREWVSEKYQGQIRPEEVVSITLTDLRSGGPDGVSSILQQFRGGQVGVVNAATYRDVEVFVAGLLQAESIGKRFIYRTAASFVRVRAGLAPGRLLTSADLAVSTSKGGLIIAGSYIQKSTLQIEAVQSLRGMTDLEVSVAKLLDPDGRAEEIRRVIHQANGALAAGHNTLIFTSRQLVAGSDAVSSLQIGQVVSAALVEIVQNISARPAWMIAKGGITASDIATRGLQVKRAQVLGQAIPGVPIWCTDPKSRWPGLIYVVFPGNVGGPGAIAQMVQFLDAVPRACGKRLDK
jgi:uncharacterized protein YgbK (DUF1537 family)